MRTILDTIKENNQILTSVMQSWAAAKKTCTSIYVTEGDSSNPIVDTYELVMPVDREEDDISAILEHNMDVLDVVSSLLIEIGAYTINHADHLEVRWNKSLKINNVEVPYTFNRNGRVTGCELDPDNKMTKVANNYVKGVLGFVDIAVQQAIM